MPASRKKSKSVSSLLGKGLHTLNTVLTGVDSIAETVNKVAPGIVDETTKVIDHHLDKHKDDFKMPGLIDVPLDEAERVLQLYRLHYSLILVNPDVKYAGVRPHVVLAITPKEHTNVSARTFVRAYYADNDVIEASRKLADQQEADKRRALEESAQARRDQISKLAGGVKSLSLGTLRFAKTLSLHKANDAQDIGEGDAAIANGEPASDD